MQRPWQLTGRTHLQLAGATAAAAAVSAGLAAAAAARGAVEPGVAAAAQPMRPAVRKQLAECYGSGRCRAGELDDRVLQSLACLSERDGIAALAEFMRADMAKIRNKSAYLSCVVQRIKEGGVHPRAPATGPLIAGVTGTQALAEMGGGLTQAASLVAGAAAANAAVALEKHQQAVAAVQRLQHQQMLAQAAALQQQHTTLWIMGGLGRVTPSFGAGVGGAGVLQGVQGGGFPVAAGMSGAFAAAGAGQAAAAGNISALGAPVRATMEQLFLRGVHPWEVDQKWYGCSPSIHPTNLPSIHPYHKYQSADTHAHTPHSMHAYIHTYFHTYLHTSMYVYSVDGLASMPEKSAVEALQDFSCRDLKTIRNKSAYLMGCISKHKDAGGGDVVAGSAVGGLSLSSCSEAVKVKLEAMFSSGLIARETLDYRAWEAFCKLSETSSLGCLDEFIASDIRCVSRFCLDCVRQLVWENVQFRM